MNWKCLFFHDWVDLDYVIYPSGPKRKSVCVRCKKVIDEIEEHVKEERRKRLTQIEKEKLAKEIFDEHSQK